MADVKEIERSGQIADFHASGVVEPVGIFLVIVAVKPVLVRIVAVTFKDSSENLIKLRNKKSIPRKQMFDDLSRQRFKQRKIILAAIKSRSFERRWRHIEYPVGRSVDLKLDVDRLNEPHDSRLRRRVNRS